MKFFLSMIPPTATAQEHQVKMIKGRPFFFDPPRVKKAKADLIEHLSFHIPQSPLEGALALTTIWFFPKGKSHQNGEWRITRPDTDNLQKILKDSMTKLGFWIDDAQVSREYVEKRWADAPTGIYIEIEKLDE